MEYEWDEAKSRINAAKHGMAFDFVEALDWSSALIVPDNRHDGELRYTAFGFIGDRLYVCIYTWRSQKRRIISLRKANSRERKFYEKET